MWKQIGHWETIVPILPVVTVEGRIVWLKRCQRRKLRSWLGDRDVQYRVLPVSDIWKA